MLSDVLHCCLQCLLLQSTSIVPETRKKRLPQTHLVPRPHHRRILFDETQERIYTTVTCNRFPTFFILAWIIPFVKRFSRILRAFSFNAIGPNFSRLKITTRNDILPQFDFSLACHSYHRSAGARHLSPTSWIRCSESVFTPLSFIQGDIARNPTTSLACPRSGRFLAR